jgi:hypothetical protein
MPLKISARPLKSAVKICLKIYTTATTKEPVNRVTSENSWCHKKSKSKCRCNLEKKKKKKKKKKKNQKANLKISVIKP